MRLEVVGTRGIRGANPSLLSLTAPAKRGISCQQLSGLQHAAQCSIYVICLCVMLAGCKRAEIETCSVFLGKDISLDRYGDYSIVDGTHMLFEYYHEVPELPNAADTGMTEGLVFQIDPGAKNFTIVDADLAAHATTYRFSAFSPYNDSSSFQRNHFGNKHLLRHGMSQ